MRKLLLTLVWSCIQLCDCSAGESNVDSPKSASSAASKNNTRGDPDKKDYHFFRIPSSVLQEKDAAAPSATTSVAAKNIYDQVAKQLAGLYIPDDRLNDPASANYAKFISDGWDSLMKASLSPLFRWAEEHVAPFVKDVKTVFYPFGGPDIAYAIGFFPTAQNYVLVGLEPIGDFDSIKNDIKNVSMLTSVGSAVSYFLQHSFFVTDYMSTQLSSKSTKGGLCLILLELAKLGFNVDSVENICINAKGVEVAREKNTLRCIKIIFSKADENFHRSVYYTRADLQNSRDSMVVCLKNFLKQTPFVTLVKSASYVMHDSAFSKIRDFILFNTRLLLQDDSGIPFYHFNSLKWERYIFGEYTDPTGKIFQKNKQMDLADYYATHEKIGIPFKIGYGYNKERPNLFLAIPRRFAGKMLATNAMRSRAMSGKTYPDFVALAHDLVKKKGEGDCSCKRKERPRELPPIPLVNVRFLLPIPPDTVELWN
jgi:hypothetical protein